MRYIYSSIEEYIKRMYQDIGIYHPHKLKLGSIASAFGLTIIYVPMDSMHNNGIIYLDNRLSEQEQWQDFCHELCHALWHTGNQMNMPLPFRLYQEWKAASFAFHACIPTFMLEKIALPFPRTEAIGVIADVFGVEGEFAEERFDIWMWQKESQKNVVRIVGF